MTMRDPQWQSNYVGRRKQADIAFATLKALREQLSTGGRKCTREDMAER